MIRRRGSTRQRPPERRLLQAGERPDRARRKRGQDGGREFLFDLESASHEKKNRVASESARAATLRGRLTRWAATLERPGLPEGPLNRGEMQWFDHYLGASR